MKVFSCGSAGKESACNVGDLGSIPGLGRSPGEGKGYPLQYSGLENSMDCVVHGAVKSRTSWKFSSIYPQNQSLPTFCFVLSPSPLTLQGAVPDYLSLKKRVNLQLQLIKFLGVIVFQPTNSFASPLACLNRFFWPHVIAQSNCERHEMF